MFARPTPPRQFDEESGRRVARRLSDDRPACRVQLHGHNHDQRPDERRQQIDAEQEKAGIVDPERLEQKTADEPPIRPARIAPIQPPGNLPGTTISAAEPTNAATTSVAAREINPTAAQVPIARIRANATRTPRHPMCC
jgi:hypothetical protein